MQFFMPSRLVIFAVAVLLATNIITGSVTAWYVHSHDFSELNMNCLLNWGSIGAQFEDAKGRELPGGFPQNEAQVYRIHENNARFLVHYPKFSRRTGDTDDTRAMILFCWAVAADKYHYDNVDIPVDPEVWQAFLTDGPKQLPLYWRLRESLTDAGAGQGLIRGDAREFPSGHKPSRYKMGPLSTPYHPLPGEDVPS
jgi:hypothetical protein